VLKTPTPLVPSKEHARIEPPLFSSIKLQTAALPKPPTEDDERPDGFSIVDKVSTYLDEREQRHGLVALFLQTFPSLEYDTPIRTEFGDIVKELLESDGSTFILKEEALEAARNYFQTLGAVYVRESGSEKKRKSEEIEEEESGPPVYLDVADGRTIIRKLFDGQNGEDHQSLR
jgi:hypothetical protein